MSVAVLLSRLADRGIHFHLDGGELRYRGPPGALTDADKAALRARREAIVAYLGARAAAAPPSPKPDPAAPPTPALYQQVWWRLVRASSTPLRMEKVPLLLPFEATSPEAAVAALRGLVARHHTLRSRFHEEDGALRLTINPPEGFPVAVETVADEAAVQTRAAEFVQAPLPVDGPWLTRGLVLQVEGGRTFVGLLCHHIVFDGSSLGLAAGELNDRIAGFAPVGEAVQFVDYARWEQDWFSGRAAPLTGWWRDWLAELPPLRSPSGRDLRWLPGARVDHPLDLPEGLSQRVHQAALRLGSTPFAVVLSAYARALARWSGQPRFAIRAIGDLRASQSLAQTIGLLICADALEIEDVEDDLGQLAGRLGAEFRSAAAMRVPPHPAGTGAGFEEFHERIGATLNYIPAGAVNIATRGPPIALPIPPNRPQTLPWPVPLPSIFLRLWDAPSGMGGRLEFNEAALEPTEQAALVAEFLKAMAEVAPV